MDKRLPRRKWNGASEKYFVGSSMEWLSPTYHAAGRSHCRTFTSFSACGADSRRARAHRGSDPTSSRSPLEGSRAYATRLQAVIADARPDWYWNPNPLMVNVRYPIGLQGVRKAITVYDLIPLRLPNDYLNKWDSPLAADYRARLQDIADSASVVIPISTSTANDFAAIFPDVGVLIRPIALSSDYFACGPCDVVLQCPGIDMSCSSAGSTQERTCVQRRKRLPGFCSEALSRTATCASRSSVRTPSGNVINC